ncbi:SidA/IucD/PvdA family monooxygenase [Serratia fonticola]|nr:SidA/IucD/PvdA family monooxygenase [Serratia fonticola]
MFRARTCSACRNLSLAALLHPHPHITSAFFEQRSEFQWHPGLMLPNLTLQISFMKDLVSLVDPTSKLSFLAYLAFPIMPGLGKALWSRLGCEGDPQRDQLLARSQPEFQDMGSPWFLPLSIESLRPCLPASLIGQASCKMPWGHYRRASYSPPNFVSKEAS